MDPTFDTNFFSSSKICTGAITKTKDHHRIHFRLFVCFAYSKLIASSHIFTRTRTHSFCESLAHDKQPHKNNISKNDCQHFKLIHTASQNEMICELIFFFHFRITNKILNLHFRFLKKKFFFSFYYDHI